MAYREVTRVEINEVIRRWQLGLSQRQIARGTGLSRPTVRRYLAAAVELGLWADGPEPDESQLARLAALSLAGPRRTPGQARGRRMRRARSS
ncbi:MAG: helix-turn-helix domain-containing protein [Chloroflexota bacterium]|nr:helix-turn-helix domain-containing protein [Chloroflexota bacterium]